MCLAIYKPKGSTISKWTLEAAFRSNSDGAGFAVARGGKIMIHKGFFHFDPFYKAYQRFQKETCIIHFRIATHGKENKSNCHPFMLCGGKYALIHNGILPISNKSDITRSDTAHFADLVLTPLLDRIAFDEPALKWLLEEAIGTGNKLVILRNDGEATIFNEWQGHWNNGSWYSNHSYVNYGACHRSWPNDWQSRKWPTEQSSATYEGEVSEDEIKKMFPDWSPYSPIVTVNSNHDIEDWLMRKEMEHDAEVELERARESEEKEAILQIQAEEGQWS